MRTGIIYSARNKINGKRYIGATIQPLERRQSRHFYNAFTSKDNHIFAKVVRKYGWDNFEWEVLYKDIPREKLDLAEMCAIYMYDSFDNGYNYAIYGTGTRGRPAHNKGQKGVNSPITGIKRSRETKEKISAGKGSKPFNVYKKDGSFVGVWKTCRSCARDLGVDSSALSKCLRRYGSFKSLKGYTFKYVREVK